MTETGNTGTRTWNKADIVYVCIFISRVRAAGSGHCGESSEHPTRFRVATWNVGSLKKRDSEVVETLSRRKVDLCGVQEHRWAGGLTPNQTRFIKGKDCSSHSAS